MTLTLSKNDGYARSALTTSCSLMKKFWAVRDTPGSSLASEATNTAGTQLSLNLEVLALWVRIRVKMPHTPSAHCPLVE